MGLTGRALTAQLLESDRRVRVLDLEPSPDPRVESIVADVRDADVVEKACAGVDTIFHTAAIVSQHPRHRARLESINVGGTRVLLDAARRGGVRRFVFTSSIDAVFGGDEITAGSELLPYPTRWLDDYGRTKAEAEQAVLAANGRDGLATCALRAAGIFGPHDRNRFPVILDYVRRNGLIGLGRREARFSHVYVDNVAHAHVLAARALISPDEPPAGRAYFITDYEPQNFFDFIDPFLAAVGVGPSRFDVPEPLAWLAAYAVEATYWAFGRWIETQPTITRYTVASTCRDFWFKHDAATRDFGYQPIVSEAEARERTIAWLREWQAAQAG